MGGYFLPEIFADRKLVSTGRLDAIYATSTVVEWPATK